MDRYLVTLATRGNVMTDKTNVTSVTAVTGKAAL